MDTQAMTFPALVASGEVVSGSRIRCVTNARREYLTTGKVYHVGYDPYTALGFVDDDGDHICHGNGATFVVLEDEQADAPTNEKPEEPDLVQAPGHYSRFAIQPMAFILRNNLPGHVANIVKYGCRAGHKVYEGKTPEESEVIDLQKAIRWANARINVIQGEAEV